MAFQFQDTLDGHMVKPSWCLEVSTKYLMYMKSKVRIRINRIICKIPKGPSINYVHT